MKLIKIDGVALPVFAQGDVSQQYEPIGGESLLRAASGRAIKQMTWGKTRIVTSGRGWVPSGLQALDYAAQHQLSCVEPLTVSASLATRQATLPSARRNDAGHVPYGLAELPSGQSVQTPVSMLANVATATAVPGAVAYQIGYYPTYTVYLIRPKIGAGMGWELIAEEV